VENTKRLLVIRHGETEYNRKGMVQGSGIDAPLNEKGRLQAKAFYQAYKNEPFDKVYVSELQRTHQSVQGFLDDQLPFEILPGLNEISWGNQEGRPFTPESANLYKKTVDLWKAGDLDVNLGGGESPNEVMKRQKTAIEHILSQKEERYVLVCMHGRAMRILMTWLIGYDLRYMDHFPHTNLGVYELIYTGSMFRISVVNNTSHLNGMT
jgi:probable phosphoglycerate mutase